MRVPMMAAAVCLAALCMPAQQASAPTNEVQRTIAAEFGANFKLDPDFAPMTGDFDGDGVNDLAVVARGANPLGAADSYGYKVIDPYDAYFGWSDPKVTLQFSATDTNSPRYVLIMHSGRDGKGKAKFVVVNLPFRALTMVDSSLKKKRVSAIAAQDYGGLGALLFWDGRKYRWEPTQIAAE